MAGLIVIFTIIGLIVSILAAICKLIQALTNEKNKTAVKNIGPDLKKLFSK